MWEATSARCEYTGEQLRAELWLQSARKLPETSKCLQELPDAFCRSSLDTGTWSQPQLMPCCHIKPGKTHSGWPVCCRSASAAAALCHNYYSGVTHL